MKYFGILLLIITNISQAADCIAYKKSKEAMDRLKNDLADYYGNPEFHTKPNSKKIQDLSKIATNMTTEIETFRRNQGFDRADTDATRTAKKAVSDLTGSSPTLVESMAVFAIRNVLKKLKEDVDINLKDDKVSSCRPSTPAAQPNAPVQEQKKKKRAFR